ncbi:hypothetical protein B484DRAFT_12342 [Ochromonadaceae sp. CCMP2298]|nr:hypothetical protein B484DRAFT_12342 [Ochromonadaceae sp. CCMP2298]
MRELGLLMLKMGLELSDKRLKDLMTQYDVDQGGKIELHEFLMLLKSQHKEAQVRIFMALISLIILISLISLLSFINL